MPRTPGRPSSCLWVCAVRVSTGGALTILPFLLFPKALDLTPVLLAGLTVGRGISIGLTRGLPGDWERRFRLVLSVAFLFGVLWFLLWGLHAWERDSRNVQAFAGILVLAGTLLTELRFARWSDPPSAPIASIQDVAVREREWIRARREACGVTVSTWSPTGLALSGGGIRSAAVSLGFLRQCADEGIFRRFDYLSTVSGGGWAGTAAELLFTQGRPPRAPEWDRLCAAFLHRRGYLTRASLLRGLIAMTMGALALLCGALLFIWTAVAFLFWVEILDSMLNVGDNIVYRTRPLIPSWLVDWLANAPLAPTFLSRSLSGFLPIVTAGILAVTASVCGLHLGGRLARNTPICKATMAPLVFLTRLSAALLGLLFVLQGRDAVTFVAFGALTFAALSVFRTLTATRIRIAAAVCLVALLWGSTFAMHFSPIATCTDAWRCVLARTIGLEWRIAGAPGVIRCAFGEPAQWIPVRDDPTASSVIRFFDVGVLASALFTVLGFTVQQSRTALFRWWSGRIGGSFLTPASSQASRAPISALRDGPAARYGAPFPILNATVNLPGSYRAHDGASRFEMTPLFFGGPLTGWRDAEEYDALTVADCVAVSAAAVNSQGGSKIPWLARWVLLFTNFRLGIWLRNPRFDSRPGWLRRTFVFAEAFKELIGANGEEDPALFVSDGGHHDNSGISALCERNCSFIVALDAAADPSWNFAGVQDALAAITQTGWAVRSKTLPRKSRVFAPERGIGRVEVTGPNGSSTMILILKASVGDDALELMTPAAKQYAVNHSNFPQESTAHQWFTEAQFEAYFAVGRALACRLKHSEMLPDTGAPATPA